MSSARYTMSILTTPASEARDDVEAMPVEKLLRVHADRDSLIDELIALRGPRDQLVIDDVTITTAGTLLQVDVLMPRPLEALPVPETEALGRTMSFRKRRRPRARVGADFHDLLEGVDEHEDHARLVLTYDTLLWSESAEITADVRGLLAAYEEALALVFADQRQDYSRALDERHAQVVARARIDQLARAVDRDLRS